MARSYWPVVVEHVAADSRRPSASLGSSRTAVLASASARSSRPDGAIGVGALAKGAGVFRIERDGAIEIGKGALHLVDVPVGGAAVDQRGDLILRPVLGGFDQGGAGGDALFRREARCRRRPRRSRHWRWIAPGPARGKSGKQADDGEQRDVRRMGAPSQIAIGGGQSRRRSLVAPRAKQVHRPKVRAFGLLLPADAGSARSAASRGNRSAGRPAARGCCRTR